MTRIFSDNMLADYRSRPEPFVAEVRAFLQRHRTDSGIILDAERRLNVLRRAVKQETLGVAAAKEVRTECDKIVPSN